MLNAVLEARDEQYADKAPAASAVINKNNAKPTQPYSDNRICKDKDGRVKAPTNNASK